MITREHVWTEVTPSDGISSSELDSRPPISSDENVVRQPVRNELLARSVTTELPHLGGEAGLGAAGSLDSSYKSADMGGDFSVVGNVVSLHAVHATRKLVVVNKESRFTDNKGPCTVISMATTKRKTAVAVKPQPRKRSSGPLIGPDGLTMSQRVVRLMSERNVGQSELARTCSQYYAAFVPTEEEPVKQQHIFNIIQGQESSWVLPLIAAVFDVNDMWLQFGIGQRDRKKN